MEELLTFPPFEHIKIVTGGIGFPIPPVIRLFCE